MDRFDDWQDYWDKYLFNRYGKDEVKTEDDLYLQVARTQNRNPVVKEVFEKIIERIDIDLGLDKQDILVDFCCGNGLFTFELKDKVARIIGIDFSQKIIDTANKFKQAMNITYRLGTVLNFISSFSLVFPGVQPTKFLMNDSLAYFNKVELEEILEKVKMITGKFKFLLRGVPDDELKWNYYNTTERKQFFADLLAKKDITNDGLGTWWNKADIIMVCDKLGLDYLITEQKLPVSDFRIDVLISR